MSSSLPRLLRKAEPQVRTYVPKYKAEQQLE
jgi:hypothetical protein